MVKLSGSAKYPPAPPMATCVACNERFQHGMHTYGGEWLPRYQMMACDRCYAGNWDGWAPHCEPQILAHLKAKELPVPERNAKGFLPRD